ncbi:hypothetical protein [Amphibacillus cookii]|uniref:hypothetical protein n=1 Tax=Amphibacillus cookii TaxID=767787 RepID=UPI0019569D5F|nr:hypothetical protein [Amphibacillus cookii]MBM7540037.1 hypothetical protein [Amphibacillus cookii]
MINPTSDYAIQVRAKKYTIFVDDTKTDDLDQFPMGLFANDYKFDMSSFSTDLLFSILKEKKPLVVYIDRDENKETGIKNQEAQSSDQGKIKMIEIKKMELS